MFDNGLLKFYKTCPSDGGFLDVSKIGFVRRDAIISKTTRCKIVNRDYYLKVHNASGGVLSKPLTDAEILLSQLYSKLGISSAIYLPAQSNGERFLLSNDVEKPNVVLAADFLNEKIHRRGAKTMPFLSQTVQNRQVERLYTPGALAQQTKLRILDTVTYNTDRHYGNFFYTLSHPSPSHYDHSLGTPPTSTAKQVLDYFRSLRPNKAEDIVAIDFESSGGNFLALSEKPVRPEEGIRFMNDFKNSVMGREEIISEFTNNKKLEEVLDKEEFAEELGSLDIPAVAEDIQDATGYEVDKKFVDFLSQSCEEVAESLEK